MTPIEKLAAEAMNEHKTEAMFKERAEHLCIKALRKQRDEIIADLMEEYRTGDNDNVWMRRFLVKQKLLQQDKQDDDRTVANSSRLESSPETEDVCKLPHPMTSEEIETHYADVIEAIRADATKESYDAGYRVGYSNGSADERAKIDCADNWIAGQKAGIEQGYQKALSDVDLDKWTDEWMNPVMGIQLISLPEFFKQKIKALQGGKT